MRQRDQIAEWEAKYANIPTIYSGTHVIRLKCPHNIIWDDGQLEKFVCFLGKGFWRSVLVVLHPEFTLQGFGFQEPDIIQRVAKKIHWWEASVVQELIKGNEEIRQLCEATEAEWPRSGSGTN